MVATSGRTHIFSGPLQGLGGIAKSPALTLCLPARNIFSGPLQGLGGIAKSPALALSIRERQFSNPCDVAVSTAFRWRHRFLAAARHVRASRPT